MLMLAACVFSAQGAEMLIAPEKLVGELKNPKLVVLHVGSEQDYEAGHLPGARLVKLGDLSMEKDGLRLQMLPMETLRERLMGLGIGDDSRVVIYAGNESVQSATRIWFTFDYVSLGAVMLDGGLAGWKAQGLPVTQEKPQVVAATALTLRPRPELIVDAAWVNAHRMDPGVSLVDARLEEFYTGKNAGNMPRSGHIPGAKNVPFPSLLGAGKEFLKPEEIREKLGSKPVAAYCHIGMQATVVYFSARLAGIDVKLYDGSYEDWSRQVNLPVEANQ